MGEDKPTSKIVAKVEYEQKFNLGNYSSETIKVVLEGPIEEVIDSKDVARLLLGTATNLKKITQKVHDNVDPKKYDNLPDGVEVKKEEPKKSGSKNEDDI